jgi:hypothetical protein
MIHGAEQSDRELAQSVMSFCISEINNLGGDIMTVNQALLNLDQALQQVQRTIHTHPDRVLCAWLRSTYVVRRDLPTWQPLLFSVMEVLTQRGGAGRANDLLIGLGSQK